MERTEVERDRPPTHDRLGAAFAMIVLLGTARCASSGSTSATAPAVDPTTAAPQPTDPATAAAAQVVDPLSGAIVLHLWLTQRFVGIEDARRRWLDVPVRGSAEGDVCSGYTPYRTCPDGMVCVVLGEHTNYGECQRGVVNPGHIGTCSDGSPARPVAVDESDDSGRRARWGDELLCLSPLHEGVHTVMLSEKAYGDHPERYDVEHVEDSTVSRYVPRKGAWSLHNEVVVEPAIVRCEPAPPAATPSTAGERCDPECGRGCSAGLVCVKQAFELHGNDVRWRADCQPEGRSCTTDACGDGEACFNPEFLTGQHVSTVADAVEGRCQHFDLVDP